MIRFYYYKTQHPEIAAEEIAFQQRQVEYDRLIAEIEAEVGLKAMVDVYQTAKVLSAFGTGKPESINDLKVMLSEGKIDPRLTLLQGRNFFSPNQKTRDGRAFAKRMSKIRLDYAKLIGLPGQVYSNTDSKMYRPSSHKMGDTWWAGYRCNHSMVEAWDKFRPDIWERALSSEYWLAAEAAKQDD